MSSDTKDLFFSKNNLEFTFEQVKKNIKSSNGYDISKNKKLKDHYNKMSVLVYENTNELNTNLVNLNNSLVENASSYFNKLINNRKDNIQTNTINNNNRTHPNLASVNQIKQNYNQLTETNNMRPPDGSSELYNPLQRTQNVQNTRPEINNYNHSNTSNNQKINKIINKESDVNLLPFTLSDEFINEINNGDQPIYNNMALLENNENKDTMTLLDEQQNNRDLEMQRYTNQLKKQKENTNKIVPNNFSSSNNNITKFNNGSLGQLSLGRDDALVDTRIDNIQTDPKEMYAKNEDLTNRMVNSMTTNNIEGNQTNNNFEQMFIDTLHKMNINYRADNQPVYLEKEHFVSINSIDRNWSSSSNTESRYNFKVSFGDNRGTDGPQNAIVETLFKNIVSIELINVYIPQDPIIIPFDNRIYLDALHYPYLLLQVDEINSVFRSSNNAANNAFSQLMFDKDHSSQVLSTDFIGSDSEPAPDTRFEKQFNRGYYRFVPSFFEKKQYYNSPLASLSAMTIQINNPDGDALNSQSDVLKISAITSEAIADQELTATKGFPNTDNSSNNNKYIKITTTNHFFNKQFKLGDRIKLGNVVADNTTLQSYLNRDSGHHIINLEEEDITANTVKNKSSINIIYISPPGDLDSSNEALDTSTYIDADSGSISYTLTNAYLINMSLQTNILFKIVTREVDVQNITKPQNI
jgi:hypothetical protein